MTYCVVVAVEQGLVFCSDSRTNAGIDRVSTYSKMHKFIQPSERKFVILSSGNLATTQAVIAEVQRDIDEKAEKNLFNIGHMTEAAEYLGQLNVSNESKHVNMAASDDDFKPEATFIIGGQIKGEAPQAFLVYPQGNYITTSEGTPYLQIGESKYGKPILDRVINSGTSLDDSAKCSLVSMDSTMRSNLSVGPPIELLVYEKDTFDIKHHVKFEGNSSYLREVADDWDKLIAEAFDKLPAIDWVQNTP